MRGKLIETVGGCPIYAKGQPGPNELVEARRGRLEKGGPLYEVHRIGQGAAYLFKVYDPPKEVVLGQDAANDAIDEMLREIKRGTPDSAYHTVRGAVRLALGVKTIIVSKGPVEPGISKSAFFAEVI